MALQLQISERRFGDVAVVGLSGRLVADDEDIFFKNRIDALLEQGVTKVVVDLHDVTLVDSGGVGVLVAKLLTLRGRGGDLRLARLTSRSWRVLSIAHLLTVFQPYDSVAEAVQSFGATAAKRSNGIPNARAAH